MAKRIHSSRKLFGIERPWRRISIVIGAIVALMLGLGASSAFAYFTTHGSDTGSARNGTMLTVTVATAGTPSAPLLPGGTGDVVFSVTNPNSFPVSLVGVTLKTGGTITPDSGHSGCMSTDALPVVTLNVPPGDLPVSIAAHTTMPIDLADAASMDLNATSNCQGATFTIPITITAQSS